MVKRDLEAIMQKDVLKKVDRSIVIKSYIEMGALTLGAFGFIYGAYWISQYFPK